MSGSYAIGDVRPDEWTDVARLVGEAVPNAILSHLGSAFGARFYRAIAAQSYACAFAAHDGAGRLLGVIIGSQDQGRSYAEAVGSQRLRLALAANVRLLAPATIRWVLRGLFGKKGPARAEHRPEAELLVITVRPEARGTGLAEALVKALESFLRARGHRGPYVIRTEAANERANRFYARIGARLACEDTFHGRRINEWHKDLPAEGAAP